MSGPSSPPSLPMPMPSRDRRSNFGPVCACHKNVHCVLAPDDQRPDQGVSR